MINLLPVTIETPPAIATAVVLTFLALLTVVAAVAAFHPDPLRREDARRVLHALLLRDSGP